MTQLVEFIYGGGGLVGREGSCGIGICSKAQNCTVARHTHMITESASQEKHKIHSGPFLDFAMPL